MSHPLYEFHQDPGLSEPVLLVALEGWIDAGGGAASAAETILASAEQIPSAARARSRERAIVRTRADLHDGVDGDAQVGRRVGGELVIADREDGDCQECCVGRTVHGHRADRDPGRHLDRG